MALGSPAKGTLLLHRTPLHGREGFAGLGRFPLVEGMPVDGHG